MFRFLLLATLISAQVEVNVIYILRVPEQPNEKFPININNYTDAPIDKTRKYKIFTHGWGDSINSVWYEPTVQEYMKRGDINVIEAAFQDSVFDIFYFGAVGNTSKIGRSVAEFIINFNQTQGIPFDNIHVIGHSLGAQVAGVIGETIQNRTNCSLARITGLDPAFPGYITPFSPYKPENHISKGDAKFVDIMHTSLLGIQTTIGDVDYIINGGRFQPGCGIDPWCNHLIPTVYFYASINSDFIITECSDFFTFINGKCANSEHSFLGENVDQTLKGKFYLQTTEEFTRRTVNASARQFIYPFV